MSTATIDGLASLQKLLDVWQLQLAAGPLTEAGTVEDLTALGLTVAEAEEYIAGFDPDLQRANHQTLVERVAALSWLFEQAGVAS